MSFRRPIPYGGSEGRRKSSGAGLDEVRCMEIELMGWILLEWTRRASSDQRMAVGLEGTNNSSRQLVGNNVTPKASGHPFLSFPLWYLRVESSDVDLHHWRAINVVNGSWRTSGNRADGGTDNRVDLRVCRVVVNGKVEGKNDKGLGEVDGMNVWCE
jgi:hypothetical protein